MIDPSPIPDIAWVGTSAALSEIKKFGKRRELPHD